MASTTYFEEAFQQFSFKTALHNDRAGTAQDIADQTSPECFAPVSQPRSAKKLTSVTKLKHQQSVGYYCMPYSSLILLFILRNPKTTFPKVHYFQHYNWMHNAFHLMSYSFLFVK